MKLPRRNFLHLAAGAATLPMASRIARAQAYPTRPVRVIVPPWLWTFESEASAHRSTEREKRDFEDRKKKFNRSLVANFKNETLSAKNETLSAPQHESAVFGLVIKLSTLDPNCFPFEISRL
jgi:hypothetical protein